MTRIKATDRTAGDMDITDANGKRKKGSPGDKGCNISPLSWRWGNARIVSELCRQRLQLKMGFSWLEESDEYITSRNN